jgi:CHAD domain-containing protein
MASVPSIDRRRPRRVGLSSRMRRVLKELRRVRTSADIDAVHDLRVAIRRCRSIAAIMEEVDAHRAWRDMKKLPRKLFRTLGALRDLQVLENWVKKLASADDPSRPGLLKALEDRQMKPRAQVRRVARAFDRDAWKSLARTLERRASLVPPNSPAAKCLALERYEELRRLHAATRRTEAPEPWHALRIGLKRFRYTVENLLPGRSAVWDEGLSQMQGLLGAIHDLDVLKTWISQWTDRVGAKSVRSLRHAIETERRSCIVQYRAHTTGSAGLLQVWNAGLMHQITIAAATDARLRTTARALDRHPRRTAEISRLTLQIFDALGASGADAHCRDDRLRVVLRTASQLHAIRNGDRRRPRHKAARDILRGMLVPLGWTSQEWDLLTEVVRYHRGAEPTVRHEHFGRLSSERQAEVRGLAGVLRLARGLRRCGTRFAPGVHAVDTPARVQLRVAGLKDSKENIATLAAAAHLLEVYLKRPILFEAAVKAAPARTLRPTVGKRSGVAARSNFRRHARVIRGRSATG